MNNRYFVLHLLSIGIGSCLFAPAAANAQNVITFDSFNGMPNSAGSPIPLESQVSNQFASEGAVFSSGSGAGFVGVVELGPNHAVSGLNGIGGATIDGNLTYLGDPLIVVRFVDPTDGVTPWVTNFVSVQGDEMPDGSTISMRAYGVADNLIDEVTKTDAGGTLLSLTDPGIDYVEITGSGTVAYDNFTFNPVTAPSSSSVAAAPEPGSILVMAPFGLLSIGMTVRRSRGRKIRATR